MTVKRKIIKSKTKTKSKPKKKSALAGFVEHGIDLQESASGAGHQVGDCPFCGRVGKFYVNSETGSWDCKRCGLSGGYKKFLEEKSKIDRGMLKGKDALILSKSRGVSISTLKKWRVGWNGNQYTIPVDVCGKTYDLRRYTLGKKVYSSTGGNVSLVGILDESSDVVWVCEGEWDGMAFWEALQSNNQPGSVLSVTGANSFPGHAVSLFRGKKVCVVLDNDQAGQTGSKRIFAALSGVTKSVQFVHWPDKLPKGFDVRDVYLKKGKHTVAAIKMLLRNYPPGSAPEDADMPQFDGGGLSLKESIKRYRKWLYLPNAEVISIMYGSVLANRLDGDPLWMFFIAPPGGTKTEVLMSLTGAPLIMTTTSLTPPALISGSPNLGGTDPSLIPKLDGKVLIVKDFTTILDMPVMARDEIFGILRDAYDGRTEKYFGNGIHRVYESRFGILGGVTPIIEAYAAASSMLGERFLKYRLPQVGHLQSGGAIIEAALNNIAKESKMREQLQQVAHDVLNIPITDDDIPEIPKHMRKRIIQLAHWVSALRGVVRREKYTNTLVFKPTQEIGTRIAKQLAKLGMGVAMFHGKKKLDEVVYQMIVSVARSTSPDRVEEIVKQLFLRGRGSFVPSKDVAKWTRFPEGTAREILQDLELLRIVQGTAGHYGRKWALSKTMLRLMRPLGLYKREEIWTTAKRSLSKRRTRNAG